MRTEADVRYAGFIVLFLLTVAALAQFRPAVVITPEDAMRHRVRAFTLTEYRIALLVETRVTQGRETFRQALEAIAADDDALRALAIAQTQDPASAP